MSYRVKIHKDYTEKDANGNIKFSLDRLDQDTLNDYAKEELGLEDEKGLKDYELDEIIWHLEEIKECFVLEPCNINEALVYGELHENLKRIPLEKLEKFINKYKP